MFQKLFIPPGQRKRPQDGTFTGARGCSSEPGVFQEIILRGPAFGTRPDFHESQNQRCNERLQDFDIRRFHARR